MKKFKEVLLEYADVIFYITLIIFAFVFGVVVTKEFSPKTVVQEAPVAKTIDLYSHIDPATGVYYYIYEGHMYPRVNPDGSYYTLYSTDKPLDDMAPVSPNYVQFIDEKESN